MINHYQTHKFLILIGLITLFIFPSVPKVNACTPTPEGRPVLTIADRVASADLVFEGTVIAVDDSNPNTPSANVEVARYFKGNDASMVTVYNFGSSAICRRFIEVGEQLIFYVLRHADGSLHAYWQTAGGAVMSVNAGTIQEIMAVLSATPTTIVSSPTTTPPHILSTPTISLTPTPTPVSANPDTTPSSQFTQSIIGIAVLIVLIMMGEWLTRK